MADVTFNRNVGAVYPVSSNKKISGHQEHRKKRQQQEQDEEQALAEQQAEDRERQEQEKHKGTVFNEYA